MALHNRAMARLHSPVHSVHFANALGHSVADKRIDILRLIAQSGSISQAARDASVSYKAAWQAIDTLTNLAGVALVERVVGGAGGGGARVTEAGEQLLATAIALEAARAQVLAEAGSTLSRVPAQALALRTSMRNQLPCTVLRLEPQGRIVRVVLQLGQGGVAEDTAHVPVQLVSRITQESAELLVLIPGLPVLALCKATAVLVTAAASAVAKPGLNLLPGHASRITRASSLNESDEIAVTLAGGLQLSGFTEPGSRLRNRGAVVAAMDEAAVVIALNL